MSSCAASSRICCQKASFAFAILASSPIGAELSSSPCASPHSTQPRPRLLPNRPPPEPEPSLALSQMRRNHGGRREINCRSDPTPLPTHDLDGCSMNSLSHFENFACFVVIDSCPSSWPTIANRGHDS